MASDAETAGETGDRAPSGLVDDHGVEVASGVHVPGMEGF